MPSLSQVVNLAEQPNAPATYGSSAPLLGNAPLGGTTKPTAAAPGTFTPNFGGLTPQDWMSLWTAGQGGNDIMGVRQQLMQRSGLDSNGIDNFINYGSIQGWGSPYNKDPSLRNLTPSIAPTPAPGSTPSTTPASGMLGSGDNFPGSGSGSSVTTYQNAVNGIPDNTDWSKIDINQFLNPNVDYLINKGTTALQNSAAARGGLLSGSTLKGISDYAQSEAQSASYQPAVQNALANRSFQAGQFNTDRNYQTALNQWNQNFGQQQSQFNTGTDLADRQFFANQAQQDWQNNYTPLALMAQLGLSGTSGDANMQAELARLLAANGLTAAQVQSAGTVGQGNAITNAISQLLSNLYGNQIVNSIPQP